MPILGSLNQSRNTKFVRIYMPFLQVIQFCFNTSQEIIGIILNFSYFVNINYCTSYLHWYTLKFPMNVLEVETLFDKYKDW